MLLCTFFGSKQCTRILEGGREGGGRREEGGVGRKVREGERERNRVHNRMEN